ncbi:molybdenum cofactor biosynthesis protein MoaE [Agromyces sp. CFH 90414]|uniref:Molybdenum cofactor biosynthesis protein MoaE n=1 Tax=Agromyces agglutinans TaxID=2662258 RepID=A0A6I2F8I5_9MICO|nr:molybdenum cofactor biosynthesis protein MoaE [Agromyces agglutinans]MRG61152.1 molybdenum cofactor biosynthesis protein MoaE [Agromyces agglutinans]
MGAVRATLAAISAEPLDVAAHLDAVADPGAGAVATFVGVVRDHDPEASGTVVALEYLAHPDAGRVLDELAGRFAADGVRVAVSHRTGLLAVGDLALVCAVSTAHRAEAFEICRALVEAVKAELPVWKKQNTADGDAHWVGLA